MSRFIIEGNELYLKTPRHKVIVAHDVTNKLLLDLATDLTATALIYTRKKAHGVDFIWCSELERKVIYFLDKGYTQKQIAKRCNCHPDSVGRCIRRLKAKVELLYRQSLPKKEPKNQIKFQKVKVSTIPFSQLLQLDNDEDEENIFEPSDNGLAQSEVYRQLEIDTDITKSDTYQLLVEKKQKKLAILLSQGLSREECAKKLGLKSTQAIHQMIARMRKHLRKCKTGSTK